MSTQIEENIAKNIVTLRKEHGYKQADLGNLIGYSDKTVSKWENGTSVPDINALSEMAKLFSITVDDLLSDNAVIRSNTEYKKTKLKDIRNKVASAIFTISLIFMAATVAFFYYLTVKGFNFWQIFVWAIPVSCAYLILYNKRTFHNKFLTAVSVSVVVWSTLASIYLQVGNAEFWYIFFLGIPAQFAIVFFNLSGK